MLQSSLAPSLLAVTLLLPQTTPSGAQSTVGEYSAFGGGHVLKEVREEGRYLTLEDGSRWEIDPDVWFQTVDWQPQAQITVRHTREEDGFSYEIDNTDEDEGALAKYLGKSTTELRIGVAFLRFGEKAKDFGIASPLLNYASLRWSPTLVTGEPPIQSSWPRPS